MNNSYFTRYKTYDHYSIPASPKSDLKICVVIPCFNEPDVVSSVLSVLESNSLQQGSYEIIVVINHPENAQYEIKQRNYQSFDELNELTANVPVHIIKAYDLSDKDSGVGTARKIGMDEACKRFIEVDNDGVIVCYDADCRVQKNYLESIEKTFVNPRINGASIKFAHPLEGDLPNSNYEAIIKYELFLRYYNCGLRYAQLPYSFHTVGSSMAVRCSAYMKQGGMNRRKAGEDFYFLHKIISLGGFAEINDTCVIPSPRVSDRVPFGTGRALLNHQSDSFALDQTYDVGCFAELRKLTDLVAENKSLNQLPDGLNRFFEDSGLFDQVNKLRTNTASDAVFQKRFYEVFDAFKCLKFVHFYRDFIHPNKPLLEESQKLMVMLGNKHTVNSELEMLLTYREFEAQKKPSVLKASL